MVTVMMVLCLYIVITCLECDQIPRLYYMVLLSNVTTVV